MRVLVVPSWYNSPKAPTRGVFVLEQAQALARLGAEVSIFAFDRDAKGPLLSVNQSLEHGLPHFRVAVPSPWHRIIGFYAPTLLAKVLAKIIEEVQPDVVHSHAVRPAGVVAQLACNVTGTPHCVTEHAGPLRNFWWTRHGAGQIDRAYHGADRLFGVSKSLIAEMQHWFPGGARHAQVLYNGIDNRLFQRGQRTNRSDELRLLFVGGMVAEKGVPDLLKAVSLLPASLNWRLSLVGIGPLHAGFRALASELNVAERLDWLGSVPHRSMPDVYAKHDMLVVSSVKETFSLVTAEALACGVPVVATRCGGPEEILQPLSLPLVPPGDPQALSEAVAQMAGRLSAFDAEAASKSIHERFSMAVLAQQLMQIYADLRVSGRRAN